MQEQAFFFRFEITFWINKQALYIIVDDNLPKPPTHKISQHVDSIH